MTTLITTQENWQKLQMHLLRDHNERFAFSYLHLVQLKNCQQYLLHTLDLVGDEAYKQQGSSLVILPIAQILPRIQRAKQFEAFLDCHSHPFTEIPTPSGTDHDGWQKQQRVFEDLAPNCHLLRFIMGQSGQVWAAVWDGERTLPLQRIIVLGSMQRRVMTPVNALQENKISDQLYEKRTVAVLGEATQQLRDLKVCIIGLGGVGSAVAAQLRGYVQHLSLVDPDIVEIHNAPRLYSYQQGDEGKPKVEVLKRFIQAGFPTVEVEAIAAPFPSVDAMESFKNADIIFCCPDHNAVRYAAAQAASRYLKPVIEVGCGGKQEHGNITALGYHVRLQVPQEICLVCNGMDLSDLEDPQTSEMKAQAGYIEDESLIRGELIALTTRAATDAVDLFFRYATGYAPISNHLYFDALRWQILDLSQAYQSHPHCPRCGTAEEKIWGLGDQESINQMISASSH